MMRDGERPPVQAHQRFAADCAAFAGLGLAARFERIYASNLWGAPTSASGLGSEVGATVELRAALPALLKRLGIRSLLDAPCGDGGWFGGMHLDIDYHGVDIVPGLITALAERDARRFSVADITHDDLPRGDAILCRDTLVHLSFANIARAVANFRRSGAIWLITTTFTDWQTNIDIDDGDWRALNLGRTPFNWPPPHAVLNEGCTEAGGGYRDKSLGVWRLADLG